MKINYIFSVLYFLIATIFYSCNPYKKTYALKEGMIEYTEDISENEAKAIAKLLLKANYFNSNIKNARLGKEKNVYKVQLLASENEIKNENNLKHFENIGGEISDEILNQKPVEIILCDHSYNSKVVLQGINFGEMLTFKAGELYYKKSITKEEAQKVGVYLEKVGFYDKNPKAIQMSKKGNTIELKMIIDKNTERTLPLIKSFMHIAKELSDKVLNKTPVIIHLCDGQLQILQTVMPA